MGSLIDQKIFKKNLCTTLNYGTLKVQKNERLAVIQEKPLFAPAPLVNVSSLFNLLLLSGHQSDF